MQYRSRLDRILGSAQHLARRKSIAKQNTNKNPEPRKEMEKVCWKRGDPATRTGTIVSAPGEADQIQTPRSH